MTQFTMPAEETTEEGGTAPKEFKLLPDGAILLAEVLEAEERDSFFWIDKEDHSKGKQREVNFKFAIIEEGEYKGWKVWGTTPTTFNHNENCKLRHWVEEIFAWDEVPAGTTFDTSDLLGQPVSVIIAHKDYVDKTTGKDKTRVFVENLVRYDEGYEETTLNAF